MRGPLGIMIRMTVAVGDRHVLRIVITSFFLFHLHFFEYDCLTETQLLGSTWLQVLTKDCSNEVRKTSEGVHEEQGFA